MICEHLPDPSTIAVDDCYDTETEGGVILTFKCLKCNVLGNARMAGTVDRSLIAWDDAIAAHFDVCEPLTLDTVMSDYCKWDEPNYEEIVDVWVSDLDSVDAEYDVNADEVPWSMTLKQAFELKRDHGWFTDDGFYGPNAFESMAGFIEVHPG